MILYEAGNLDRQVHTDGRQLPKEFDLPAFNGYSAGRWEGDTLVVETIKRFSMSAAAQNPGSPFTG
jgi:hypothetical protein